MNENVEDMSISCLALIIPGAEGPPTGRDWCFLRRHLQAVGWVRELSQGLFPVAWNLYGRSAEV